jgi:hypothetical protein
VFTYQYLVCTDGSPTVIVRSDGAFIPTDPLNIDFQAYLDWLDEGNEPTAYNPREAASHG